MMARTHVLMGLGACTALSAMAPHLLPAYFVGSVGEVSLATIRRYIEDQGTTERPKSKPLA